MTTNIASKKILSKFVAVVAVIAIVLCVAPVSGLSDILVNASAEAPVYDASLGSYTTTIDSNGNTVLTAIPNDGCGFRGWFLKSGEEVAYTEEYTLPKGANKSDYIPVFYNFNLNKNFGFENYAVGTNMKTDVPADEIWEGMSDSEAQGKADWTTATVTDTVARTGTKSLEAVSYSNATYHELKNLETDTQYTLSFWFYIPPSDDNKNKMNFVSIVGEKDAVSARANSAKTDKYIAHKLLEGTSGICEENVWKNVSITFYTDDNTSVKLAFTYGSSNSSPMYIDDVSLTKDIAAAPTYVTDDFKKNVNSWNVIDSANAKLSLYSSSWAKVEGVKNGGFIYSSPFQLKKDAKYTLNIVANFQDVTERNYDSRDGSNWINIFLTTVGGNESYRYYNSSSASTAKFKWTINQTDGTVVDITKVSGNYGSSFTGFTAADYNAVGNVTITAEFKATKTAETYLNFRLNGVGTYYIDSIELVEDSENFDKTTYLNENALGAVGTAIRTEGIQGLRYKTEIDKHYLTADMPYGIRFTEYGTIAIKSEYLNGKELTLNGEYDYNGVTYGAKSAAAYSFEDNIDKVFEDNFDTLHFTGVLINIPTSRYNSKYTVRPYFKYVDKNGEEDILYANQEEIAIYPVAKAAYSKRDSKNQFVESESVRQYLYNNIISKFADKSINVSNAGTPLYDNFQGISSTVYHGTIFFPDNLDNAVAKTIMKSDFKADYEAGSTNWVGTFSNLNSVAIKKEQNEETYYAHVSNAGKQRGGMLSAPFELVPGKEYEITFSMRIPEQTRAEGYKFGDINYQPNFALLEVETTDDGKKVKNSTKFNPAETYYSSVQNSRRSGFTTTWTIEVPNQTPVTFIQDKNSTITYNNPAGYKNMVANNDATVVYKDWTKFTAKFTASADEAGETSQTAALGFYFLDLANELTFDIKDVKLVEYNDSGDATDVTDYINRHNRTYTDEQAQIEIDRLVDSNVTNVRTRLDSHWMWKDGTGWDWNSTKMKAFYKWGRLLNDNGISITINAGWHLVDFTEFYNYYLNGNSAPVSSGSKGHSSIPEVNYLHGYAADGTTKQTNLYGEDSKASALATKAKNIGLNLTDSELAHYSVAAVRYAEWSTQALINLKANGVTNVEYVMPFTETGYYTKTSGGSGEELDPTYCYDEWIIMTMALQDALVSKGIRNNYKLIGPSQSEHAFYNRQVRFIEYVYEKIRGTEYENMLDINSMHCYPQPRSGYKDTVYDPEAIYASAEEDFSWYDEILVNAGVRDMEFWCDEYFTMSGDADLGENVAMHGTQFAAGLTAGMKYGINRFLSWQLFDTLWDGGSTHTTGQFVGGVHNVGTCPSLIFADGDVCDNPNCGCRKYLTYSSYVPRDTYYAVNLIGKHMNNKNAKVFEAEVIDNASENGDLYVAAIENDNGKNVILVVNTLTQVSTVEINLEKVTGKSFKRYVYDPNEIVATADATSIPSDKTISLDGTSFYDVVSAQSFAIYVED